MSKQLKADIMLLFVTFGWGISYYLIDVSLENMGPFTLNTYRFLIAFAIAIILAFPKFKFVSKVTLKYSFLLGIVLVFVYAGATFGVEYTTLSNSGFLCGLSVIITPILSCIIYKKAPEKKVTLAAIMCFVGIGLLTLTDGFSINYENLKGDLLCIMGGFAYAVDLLLTERAVLHEEVNPFQLSVFQLGVTGLFNLVLSFIFESPHLPTEPKIWVSVLFLSIFCTGLAFIIQAIAQQYTSASHVGVIFSLETVFSGFVAFVIAKEILTKKSYLGAILMITSIFIMEIDFKAIKDNKDKKKIQHT
ncbi:DMT family transporter [Sedimentibacter sp. MB31-C6]|uniref:DMT family transporter n=1 Tax=Sedimentibacter sp. MB31-C6 TaxID=3109366 RepID=UPI002DDD7ED3|nr:DMT family transporter [Sedimentibacter sp. MB36-C1]WSI03254.1 DMT family transporter [Sedimentibacter sp. MB36-C1]